MSGSWKRFFSIAVMFFAAFCFLASPAYCLGGKIGYVDSRRAFQEYERKKSVEAELNGLSKGYQQQRAKKIEAITKLRDEAELLSEEARAEKQKEINARVAELQEFDRKTRQELLAKQNEMLRVVIDDIQKVIDEMGKKGGYDYILDSQSIRYAKEGFDITDEVIKQLNKK